MYLQRVVVSMSLIEVISLVGLVINLEVAIGTIWLALVACRGLREQRDQLRKSMLPRLQLVRGAECISAILEGGERERRENLEVENSGLGVAFNLECEVKVSPELDGEFVESFIRKVN